MDSECGCFCSAAEATEHTGGQFSELKNFSCVSQVSESFLPFWGQT